MNNSNFTVLENVTITLFSALAFNVTINIPVGDVIITNSVGLLVYSVEGSW